jgi:hypothetical protein
MVKLKQLDVQFWKTSTGKAAAPRGGACPLLCSTLSERIGAVEISRPSRASAHLLTATPALLGHLTRLTRLESLALPVDEHKAVVQACLDLAASIASLRSFSLQAPPDGEWPPARELPRPGLKVGLKVGWLMSCCPRGPCMHQGARLNVGAT